MKPLVEGLKPQYSSVEIRQLDVSGGDAEALALAEKLGVQYVPSFVFATSQGVLVDTLVGRQDEKALRERLDKLK
jgi:thioredoxin-like negative regulator of GroEL